MLTLSFSAALSGGSCRRRTHRPCRPRPSRTRAVVLVEERHDPEQELVGARVALVLVEHVVAGEEDREVLAVDGAAEPLEAVVEVAVDLDVLERGAVADAAHREAIQLVRVADLVARVADRDVPEHARVVVRQDAARRWRRPPGSPNSEALDERLAVADARLVGVVGRRVAEQHDAAPQRHVGEPVLVERRQRRRGRRVVEEHVARIPCVGEAVDVGVVGDAVVVVVGRGAREDDRVHERPVRDDAALLGHDQRAGRADRRAGRHAAVRGWPRTIVPGAIVNVAPLRTKIGFCITITPVHVVFAVTSALTTVCAPASAAKPARATIKAAKSVFRIFGWLFSYWGWNGLLVALTRGEIHPKATAWCEVEITFPLRLRYISRCGPSARKRHLRDAWRLRERDLHVGMWDRTAARGPSSGRLREVHAAVQKPSPECTKPCREAPVAALSERVGEREGEVAADFVGALRDFVASLLGS